MAYKTRTVKSAPGLSQEKALITLQNHPEFKPGTRIASIYNQGGRWVAKIIEPKTAADDFGPIEDDVKDSPAELHDEKHESPIGESKEDAHEKHEEKHEQSEEKKLKELEKKLDLLLDALGISDKGEGPDVESEGPMEPPSAPKGGPNKGPSKSDPLPPGSGAKLKPGEVPNKPGMTPVGSPAFASTKQATNGSPSASTPDDMNAPGTGSSSGPVVQDGMVDEESTRRQMQPGASSMGTQNIVSFVASKLDPERELTIRQAKASIETELAQVNQSSRFRVARIKRDGDYIRAFVTRNDS